jgi:hypothetical protein
VGHFCKTEAPDIRGIPDAIAQSALSTRLASTMLSIDHAERGTMLSVGRVHRWRADHRSGPIIDPEGATP